MAGKGDHETDVFKLSVKVDIIGKLKKNKNVVEKLLKAFQTDIALLQQHLKNYPDLKSQDLHHVTKEKKHMGFEFWLKSSKALEELKCSTKNDSLVGALSDFSEKRGLNVDIGLDSQHLCFECKIEKKQYLKAKAYFTESSSESSDGETDEPSDEQNLSSTPQVPSSSTTPNERTNFAEVKTEDTVKDQQNLSSTLQGASSSTTPNERTNPAEVKTEDAVKFNNGAVSDHSQSLSTSVPVATNHEASKCEILKYFCIYLPFKEAEIKDVYMESKCKELNGTRLHLVSGFSHLWQARLTLNPDVLNEQNVFHFVVEKYVVKYRILTSSETTILTDNNEHIIDNSTIQQIFWEKISQEGFFSHVQFVMQHGYENLKDSILQMESFLKVAFPKLKKEQVINVVKELQKSKLVSDYQKSLMFGVVVAWFKDYKNLMQVVNNDVIQMLFYALCHLKKTEVPVSSLSYLSDLSFYVTERHYGQGFCFILWMSHMYPFLDETIFLEDIKWFCQHSVYIGTSDDEKTAALTIDICTVLKDRIQKGESVKGVELLLSLMKNVPLSAGMKVYSQIFDKDTGFTDIKDKIVDVLVLKISTCALMPFTDRNIRKLQYFWDQVKIESYAHLLTATFEKHILGLLSKTDHLSDEFIAFFKDEILFVKGPNLESLLQLIAKSPIKEIHQHMVALAKQPKFEHVIGMVSEIWLETVLTQYAGSSLSNQRLVSMYSYLWEAISLQQGKSDEKLVQRLENKLYTMKIKSLKPAELLKIANKMFSTSKDTQLAHDIFQQHLMRLLKEQHGTEDTAESLICICGRDLWIYDK